MGYERCSEQPQGSSLHPCFSVLIIIYTRWLTNRISLRVASALYLFIFSFFFFLTQDQNIMLVIINISWTLSHWASLMSCASPCTQDTHTRNRNIHVNAFMYILAATECNLAAGMPFCQMKIHKASIFKELSGTQWKLQSIDFPP